MSSAERTERTGHQEPEPSGFDRERTKVREALLGLVAEQGYADTDLPEVLERAGVERSAFDGLYPSLDACFAEVWREWVTELADRTRAAYNSQGDDWRDGMRAMAWELYRFLAEDRQRARICAVEVNFGGEIVHITRDHFMDEFVDLIHRGRLEGDGRKELPRARAEAIFGATWEQVSVPISNGAFDELIDVVPQILYLLFLPYLGPDAAQEELQRGREEVSRLKRETSARSETG